MLARGPACSGPAPSGSLGTGRQHSARLASRTGWCAVPEIGNSSILQCQWGRLKPHRARRLHLGRTTHGPLPATLGMENKEDPARQTSEERSEAEPSLDEQLHDARLEGSNAPDRLQTPAAVWLPFSESPHSQDVGREAAKNKRPAGSGGWGWISTWSGRVRRLLSSWVLYQVQQRLMLGALPAKVAGYFLLGAPAVVAGALLYKQVSGKSLAASLVQAFGNLYHFPGPMVLNDVNIAATAVNVVMFFMGTLTFALILGVITEDLNKRYDHIRQGSYPVTARNHTLILGWSCQLVPLLRQMEVARRERGAFPGTVVILADRPKPEMDADLASALPHTSLDIATRPGAPSSTVYVDRAGGAHAACVIVLRPDDGAPSALAGCGDAAAERQVASVLALQAVRASLAGRRDGRWARGHAPRPQNVILQTPAGAGTGARAPSVLALADLLADPATPAAAQALELDDLDLVGGLSALLARSAAQPGVASVQASLLQQTRGGAWVRVLPVDGALVGTTYARARRRYPAAACIGLVSPGRGATLNPRDDMPLHEGMGLVLLAHGSGKLRPVQGVGDVELARGEAGQAAPHRPDAEPRARGGARPRRIVVLEWGAGCDDGEAQPSRRLASLMAQLHLLAPPGSSVTVVGPCAPPGLEPEEAGEGEGEGGEGGETNGKGALRDKADPDANRKQAAGRLVTRSGASLGSRDVLGSADGGANGAKGERCGVDLLLRHVRGNPSSIDLLEEAGVAEADSVIILSRILRALRVVGFLLRVDGGGSLEVSGSEESIQGDAELVSALLLLEACLLKRKRLLRAPLHVLGTIRRPDTVQVANHILARLCRGKMTAELLQPDEIAAGVLTQMGAEPRLRSVLATLIGSSSGNGTEVFLRSPGWLGISSWGMVRFAEVAELARKRGETAIGLITRDGALILAPGGAEEREYVSEDRVVVLA
ncbi:hypothetical protein ACKKBF_B11820 [Auxenochlorella protothecoides x Auxenochlorella symbiontica]